MKNVKIKLADEEVAIATLLARKVTARACELVSDYSLGLTYVEDSFLVCHGWCSSEVLYQAEEAIEPTPIHAQIAAKLKACGVSFATQTE